MGPSLAGTAIDPRNQTNTSLAHQALAVPFQRFPAAPGVVWEVRRKSKTSVLPQDIMVGDRSGRCIGVVESYP